MEQDPPSPPSSEPPTQRAKFNEKRELAIKDAFNVNRELSRLFDETFPDVFNDFHSSEKVKKKKTFIKKNSNLNFSKLTTKKKKDSKQNYE